MRNIRLSIEYDGTNYHGWQSQKNGNTIQRIIEDSIEKIINSKVKLIGAGRTDAGVHALNQVANFLTHSNIPIESLKKGLNSILPDDIKIKSIEESSINFHSRSDAKGKIYQYIILNNNSPSPFLNRYSWHIKKPLNLDDMKEGSKYLIGKKDFSAFMASGSTVKSRIRDVKWIKWLKKDNIIIFNINADGFLRHMVRIIAGTLVYVGLNKLKASSIEDILNSKDRKKAGITAPSNGLFLKNVIY